MLFKKCASYLSSLLLTVPLVASASIASGDLHPLLEALPQRCTALPESLDDAALKRLREGDVGRALSSFAA